MFDDYALTFLYFYWSFIIYYKVSSIFSFLIFVHNVKISMTVLRDLTFFELFNIKAHILKLNLNHWSFIFQKQKNYYQQKNSCYKTGHDSKNYIYIERNLRNPYWLIWDTNVGKETNMFKKGELY